MKKIIIILLLLTVALPAMFAANTTENDTPHSSQKFVSLEKMVDTDGNQINCHGGGILKVGDTYYWYGEHRPGLDSDRQLGVACYSSKDLHTWTNHGIVMPVSDDPQSDIAKGCTIERPKVIFNKKTGKYVMWFHLELPGQGYAAARCGVAVADQPDGPFTFVKSGRVNPGILPTNLSDAQKKELKDVKDYEWWTPEWREAVEKGLFTFRDLDGGQMSRDMTLFVDEDGKAYHIYSSEENLTIQIAELSDDYTSHTGKYIRIFPGGHNEAPAIFKKDGVYWMITSGCTGWEPNQARLSRADNIMGEWTMVESCPCRGEGAEITYSGQSTFILPLKEGYIFMADQWRPKRLADSRYIWLPIQFSDSGEPFLEFNDSWCF